ncbi:MAG: hypothetical protein ACQESR_22755, partial [Planctomycetota bacterium]
FFRSLRGPFVSIPAKRTAQQYGWQRLGVFPHPQAEGINGTTGETGTDAVGGGNGQTAGELPIFHPFPHPFFFIRGAVLPSVSLLWHPKGLDRIFQAVGFFRVESCPAQIVLPLVGLAAENVIRDRNSLHGPGVLRPPLTAGRASGSEQREFLAIGVTAIEFQMFRIVELAAEHLDAELV